MKDLNKLLLAVFGAVIIVAGLSYFRAGEMGEDFFVPDTFVQERSSLIETAVMITNEINSSLDNISEVDSYLRASDKPQTLRVVKLEIAQDITRKETALKFSEILGRLTILISQVEPLQAQEQLLVIAQQGMLIVRNLLDYNEQLATLFIQVEARVSNNDGAVLAFLQDSVDALNKKADDINSANDRFNKLWRDFDDSF